LYRYVQNNPLKFVDPLGLAPGDIYPSEGSAGSSAIGDINSVSIAVGREFGGTVYPSGGGYTYTAPIMLGGAGGSLNILSGSSAIYHTHGSNDPGYDNNNFSPRDIQTSFETGLNMYLGTPDGGPVQFFSPISGSGDNVCHR